MLLLRVSILSSLIALVIAMRCFSGMKGVVNGDTIGRLEVIECNSTNYCLKMPSEENIGRKHYEGAQYACDYGECLRNGCYKRRDGVEVCCCDSEECNYGNATDFKLLITLLSVLLFLFH